MPVVNYCNAVTSCVIETVLPKKWFSMKLHLIYSRLMSMKYMYNVPGMPTFQKGNFHVPRLVVAVAAVVYLRHICMHGLC